jgi:uncharacterized membrane protein YbhN (UPF0104 family)
LRAFGVTVAVAPLLLGYTTGYLSMGAPLPAGGVGSVDAAMTAGFVLAGAPLDSALLAAIAFRLFSFWLPVIGAVLSLATLRGLRARLQAVAERRAQPPVALSPRAALVRPTARTHPGRR